LSWKVDPNPAIGTTIQIPAKAVVKMRVAEAAQQAIALRLLPRPNIEILEDQVTCVACDVAV